MLLLSADCIRSLRLMYSHYDYQLCVCFCLPISIGFCNCQLPVSLKWILLQMRTLNLWRDWWMYVNRLNIFEGGHTKGKSRQELLKRKHWCCKVSSARVCCRFLVSTILILEGENEGILKNFDQLGFSSQRTKLTTILRLKERMTSILMQH